MLLVVMNGNVKQTLILSIKIHNMLSICGSEWQWQANMFQLIRILYERMGENH